MKLISKGLLEKTVISEFLETPQEELDISLNEAVLSRYKGPTKDNTQNNPFIALISFHRANTFNR